MTNPVAGRAIQPRDLNVRRSERRVLVTLAAALLLAPLAIAVPNRFDPSEGRAGASPVDGRTVGTQDWELLWESDAQLAADLDAIAASGMTWIRLQLDWPSIQPTSATGWNWSHTDRVVDAANARGLKVLFLATYAPAWARPAGSTSLHTPPTNPDHFATFVREAAKRYAPKGVHHYEIWNEPNLGVVYRPKADPGGYTTLLKKAYSAIKAVDAQSLVMVGGLSPAADNATDLSMATFITQIYAAGAKGSFDAIAIHPYSFPWAPTYAAEWNTFYMAPALHAIMAANGDVGLQIWATEIGFPTGTSTKAVSEAGQADMLEAAVVAWDRYSFGGPLFWFSLVDPGNDPADFYQNWGLLRLDRTEKLAYTRLQQMLLSAEGVKAAPGPGSATITWNAPTTPQTAITGYQVVANPGGATATVGAAARSATLTLSDFTAYTATVQPLTADGPGVVSKPSAPFTPGSPTFVPYIGHVVEPDAGTIVMEVPVLLDRVTTRDVVADFRTQSVAPYFVASVPNDYLAATGTVTIPAGSRTATIRVTVQGDVHPEPGGDLFMVTFSNLRNATLGGYGIAVGYIEEDPGG